jgi:hypothetical protein
MLRRGGGRKMANFTNLKQSLKRQTVMQIDDLRDNIILQFRKAGYSTSGNTKYIINFNNTGGDRFLVPKSEYFTKIDSGSIEMIPTEEKATVSIIYHISFILEVIGIILSIIAGYLFDYHIYFLSAAIFLQKIIQVIFLRGSANDLLDMALKPANETVKEA